MFGAFRPSLVAQGGLLWYDKEILCDQQKTLLTNFFFLGKTLSVCQPLEKLMFVRDLEMSIT